MSDFQKIVDQVTKHFGRDEAQKQRIAAQFGFAMDAQMSEMSSRELAGHVLKELGLKIRSDADPLEALDMFLAGRRHAQQLAAGVKASALDGADSRPTFVDKYIGG
jgi:hypothetical protein